MILNRRTDRPRPHQVYIGRPSKWGNPFKLTAGDRLRVIAPVPRADCVHKLRSGRVTRTELAELYTAARWCAGARRWHATATCCWRPPHGPRPSPTSAWKTARWTREPIERLVRRMARPGARAA